jgi:hypothetical protein
MTAQATATNSVTRTRGTVAAKDAARDPPKANARDLARVVNAYPSITNQQRIDLGQKNSPRQLDALRE